MSQSGARVDVTGRAAWLAVILLAALYGVSMVDRLILALLAQPIGADLKLNDTQLGILLGIGFSVVYSISSVPISNFIDKGHRIAVIVVAALIWSGMTIVSGFATSFAALLILRAGVAFGEAALTPAAVSLIADLFPPERRAFPTAVYGSVASLMTSGTFIVGGFALAAAALLEPLTGMAGWRVTLIIVGIPGALLALVLLTVREPRMVTSSSRGEAMTFRQMLEYVCKERSFWLPFYFALALLTSVTVGALSWIPTILVRQYELTTAEAGYWFGAVGLPAAIVSSIFWPYLAARMTRAGRQEGVILCLAGSCAFAFAPLVIGTFQSSLSVMIAMLCFSSFGFSSIGALATLALQYFGPRPLRARLTSVYMLFTSLLGFASGPLMVVAFSKFWGKAPEAIGFGLGVSAALLGSMALIAFLLCYRHARRPLEL